MQSHPSDVTIVETEEEDPSKVGRWTEEEHQKFLEAYKLFGKDWRRLAQHVGTRNNVQCRTHAQKHFKKLGFSITEDEPVTTIKHLGYDYHMSNKRIKRRMASDDDQASTDDDTELESGGSNRQTPTAIATDSQVQSEQRLPLVCPPPPPLSNGKQGVVKAELDSGENFEHSTTFSHGTQLPRVAPLFLTTQTSTPSAMPSDLAMSLSGSMSNHALFRPLNLPSWFNVTQTLTGYRPPLVQPVSNLTMSSNGQAVAAAEFYVVRLSPPTLPFPTRMPF